ncbi:50S ribosomal protein L21 [bacterium]|nr:50S ribosomal protein L21 [bacterium]
MYAIVEIGGIQFKVDKASTICVPKMKLDAGKQVDLERVLLIVDNDKVDVGTPVIANAVVKATIVSHFKDDKVLVFKKKRRKTYQVLRGHRQNLTELKINGISVGKSESKAAVKPAEKKVAVKTKTTAAKKDAKTPVKKAPPKTAAKKPAAKSTATAAKKTTAKQKAASGKEKTTSSRSAKKKEA